jgi:WD40 repeat protein
LLGATSPARAADSTAPVLRIEAGSHIASIKRIAVDADGRWLASASLDKTLRVWDLSTGQLVQTLRPPIGDGQQGMLYAVAISPDGEWIATGGWTSPPGANESIYVFRRADGALVNVLPGLPDVVFDLAWSPDGRYLAATLGNGQLRAYRAGNFTVLGSDADCRNQSYGADFDRTGRLVTTCLDGRIRLYAVGANGLKLVRPAAETPGGRHPASARFSPDGSRIAVGYADAPRVDVFRADTLAREFSPDTSGVNAGVFSVAWSRDGGALFAAGAWQAAGYVPIRRWSDGGRGQYQSFPVAQDAILDLRGMPDGGVAFGAFDPAWGVIDPAGQRTRVAALPIADFRGQGAGATGGPFRVARDGSRLAFGFELWGKSPARFDLAARSLTLGEAPGDLLAARVTGLKVENWENSASPTLEGKPLVLEQYETSRSLAIDTKGQRFVLGADWSLRLYDRTGKQRWGVAVPGAACAVAITGEDKLVVAALGDGTIRWYRLEDGQELLAFFSHADRKRWVLWTPSGYYEASVGGEDLIGWHLNRGPQAAADFYPASRFRERFYRPEVIDRILLTRDEAEAVRQANAAAPRRPQQARIEQILPPSIELLSPREGERFSAPRLSVRVRLRAPADAPVTGLKVRINARPVELGDQARVLADAPAGEAIERTLNLTTLPPEDVLVQVFAENHNGVSTPAQAKLVWAGARPDAARGAEVVQNGDATTSVKPKLYLLAVGVSAYDKPALKLEFAAKDARDFAALFIGQKGGLYREVEVKLLTDGEVTRDSVVDGLEWLQRQVTSKDVGIVFLAGHGINSSDGLYYFAPANFDLDKVKRTGVVFSEIQNTVSALAGKALFFVDTCHSGAVLGRRAAAPDLTRVLNELSSAENGVVVFSSSTGRESSLENKDWGNGAFTAALLEGLAGKADSSGSGRITHKMLDYYVSERVKVLTNGAQHPVTQAPRGVPDFPIAVVR